MLIFIKTQEKKARGGNCVIIYSLIQALGVRKVLPNGYIACLLCNDIYQ